MKRRECQCGRRLSWWRALLGIDCRGCENQIRMGGGPLPRKEQR